MSQVLRKFASAKMGKLANGEFTGKMPREFILRDKKSLLVERDELKNKFDSEKREIIDNYERRMSYFRNLIEEYELKANEFKLALDGEKEENFILKTRILELEEQNERIRCHADGVRYQDDMRRYHNSLDGLHYQNTNAEHHYDRIASISDYSTPTNEDIHVTCREEFNTLLHQLRHQKESFAHTMREEREAMVRRVEDERLQLEKVVFKQLNSKLEQEIRRRQMLDTEQLHLQKTISQAIHTSLKRSTNKHTWRETNSDSGADVGNPSDCESESESTSTCCYSHEELMSSDVIARILQEQKLRFTTHYQKQLHQEKTKFRTRIECVNAQLCALTDENSQLKDKFCNEYFDTFSNFHEELSSKLQLVEQYLSEDHDPDSC